MSENRENRASSTPGSIDRTPPHNLDAERGLLGALLLDGGGDLLVQCREARLAPGHFYATANQIIYEAMLGLSAEGRPVDDISLPEALHRRGELAVVGGVGYINELTSSIEVTSYAKHWMEIVQEKALRRAIVATATSLIERALRADADAAETLSGAEQALFELAIDRDVPVEDPIDTLSRIAVQFEDAVAGRPRPEDEGRKLSWGFSVLDKRFRRLNADKGDFLVGICAEPGVGKSSFVDNVIAAALRDGKRVVKHALETSNEATMLSLAALHSGIPASVSGDLALTAEHAAQMKGRRVTSLSPEQSAAGENFFEVNERAASDAWSNAVQIQRDYFGFLRSILGKTFFAFDHTREFSDIVATTRQAARKAGGLDLIVVDYLQEVDVKREKFDREDQILDRIGRDMKKLAKKLRCPVLLIMSLNRAANGSQPTMNHIRGSGGVGFILDRVITLWRPEKDSNGTENKPSDTRQIVEIWVSQLNKRNVPGWTEKMHFHGPLKQFRDISRFTGSAGNEVKTENRGRPKGVKNGEGRAHQQQAPRFAAHDNRPWTDENP